VQQLRHFAEVFGGEEGIYQPGFVQQILQKDFIWFQDSATPPLDIEG
jgi:hypothetical protein